MSVRHVVDASAALAFLMGEPGAEATAPHLATGLMSAVNLAEVIGYLVRRGLDPARAFYLGCEIAPFEATLADRAGRLAPLTAAFGLSLGDRACLALAEREGAPVLTADRLWARLDLGIDVILVR
ncbi:type II toxin-antitoxin system VapC family toxin [Brevundimonas sp.]|jgi:ribonuclease VapC|uniref:type II toxin-antitoxin system VapC family toxin n=1 Tax=Brevundimonas sp. TaxID=1871086 RepID=UPI0037C1B041